MEKEELLQEFENGIIVGDLIKRLQALPQDLVVVNNCRDKYPITDVNVANVDYCYDEIITKKVVEIY